MVGIKAVVAAALLAAATAAANAQSWPTRPITLVYPFAPGGLGDVLARVFAPPLSEQLGQPVVVENVGGAGGMTGTARVAKSPPDGYQFVLGTLGTHAANQTMSKHPLYDAAKDFAPVALIVEQPMVLIARNDFPAKTLPEFIAYVKANQAKLQYTSAGAGSATHLACVLLNAAIGVDVTHVPYRGAGPAMQDLVAGRIDYMCQILPGATALIEAKQVKAIAVLSKGRSWTTPDLASAHEQGLTDFEAIGWYGFFLPKGTPAAIVQKLHSATVTVMDSPATQKRMHEIGADLVAPERRSPEYLQKFVESEIVKWRDPILKSGVSMD